MEEFQLYHCPACDFLFTHPVPDELSSYYQSENYLSHHTDKTDLKTTLYKTVREYQLKRKVQLISSAGTGKNILDYGCGTGMFLKSCIQNGYICTGIEPDNDARLQAQTVTGTKIHKDISFIPSESSYDVITLWHVLEHLPKPWETLSYFKGILKSTGILVIAVPNYLSHDAKYYRQYWAGYDVPRHLFHFSPSSIERIANQCGYHLVLTKPMVFDSFYVSLLSEQFSNKHLTSYPTAFIEGLRSNLSAMKTGNYSSLIYVLKNNE
ncbi:MAG: class I SAM-dependent methyltransferase [Cyclobacteriaceae bacterium]